MSRNTGKLTVSFVTTLAGGKSSGVKQSRAAKAHPGEKSPKAGQSDPTFASLPTVEPVEAWSGDPRKMRDEDRAFFKLDS